MNLWAFGITIGLVSVALFVPLVRWAVEKSQQNAKPASSEHAQSETQKETVTAQPPVSKTPKTPMSASRRLSILSATVLLAVLAMFLLLPSNWIASFGGVVVGIVSAIAVINLLALAFGDDRLASAVLVAACVLLAYNSPEATATRVVETARVASEEGLRGVITTVTEEMPKTEAELARERELERQRGIIEAERRAAEAAARVAEEAAAAQAAEDALVEAQAGPCLRTNTDKLGCQTVVFGVNSVYDRRARYQPATATQPEQRFCIAHDGGNGVIATPLGGNQYRFTAPSGAVVQFIDLPEGETFHGYFCG